MWDYVSDNSTEKRCTALAGEQFLPTIYSGYLPTDSLILNIILSHTAFDTLHHNHGPTLRARL